MEKEREERKDNIVIRGVTDMKDGEEGRKWVKEFIKDRIGVECNRVSFGKIKDKVGNKGNEI